MELISSDGKRIVYSRERFVETSLNIKELCKHSFLYLEESVELPFTKKELLSYFNYLDQNEVPTQLESLIAIVTVADFLESIKLAHELKESIALLPAYRNAFIYEKEWSLEKRLDAENWADLKEILHSLPELIQFKEEKMGDLLDYSKYTSEIEQIKNLYQMYLLITPSTQKEALQLGFQQFLNLDPPSNHYQSIQKYSSCLIDAGVEPHLIARVNKKLFQESYGLAIGVLI
jgi:hypothetical protein